MRYTKIFLVFTLSLLLIFGSSLSAFAGDPAETQTMKPTINVTVDSSGYGLVTSGVIQTGHHSYTGWIKAETDPLYPDYYFVEWQKRVNWTNYAFYSTTAHVNDVAFSISQDFPHYWFRHFKAIFAEKPDLTILVNDVTMGGYANATPGKYMPGTAISVLPILSQNHRLDYWTYNGEMRSPMELIAFNMPASDVEIKLYFEPIPIFNITTAVEDEETWGSVTGAGPYMAGSPVTLTATPARGYAFDYWEYEWDCQSSGKTEADSAPLAIQNIYDPVMAFNMPECNGHYKIGRASCRERV